MYWYGLLQFAPNGLLLIPNPNPSLRSPAMNKAATMNKAPAKKKMKKLTSKELIVKLATFVAKDAPKAILSARLEKKIIRELGRVLQEIDTHLPKKDLGGGALCWCIFDGSARCLTTSNCTLIGTCSGPCR